MQTSGFFTRSVASFAISRNLARALGAVGQALGLASLQTEELLPVAALLVHLPQVVDRTARCPGSIARTASYAFTASAWFANFET